MTSAPPSPELRRLVDRLMDGETLSRTEMAGLEEMLDSPDALAYYLSVTSQEGMMPEAIAGAEPPVEGDKVVRFPFRIIFQAAAACAIFVIGWQLGHHRPAPKLETSHSPAARITGLMGVEWKSGEEPDLVGHGGVAKRLAFQSGLVEVTYGSGVRVTLEGPADFTINDETSGKLDAGKLVASVPKGAEGFRVDYAKGNVVDLGTEFAMDARDDGSLELGVLDGKVDLNVPGDTPRRLLVNQAVIHGNDAQEPVQAIPLDREKFVRRLPARDFRWSMDSFEPKQLEFDVTHLIWKGSSYRAIFKWINGKDAIMVHDVGLFCDGELVAKDFHTGSTGGLQKVDANVYKLDLKPSDFRRGRWTIRASIDPYARSKEITGPVHSEGILQFEEGMATSAGPSDFIGSWSYYHAGKHYVRSFQPDGTVMFSVDNVPGDSFKGSHWSVTDGVLDVDVPGQIGIVEQHVLRDAKTLIFITNPYDNAVKLKDGETVSPMQR
ncbi:FecR domain-containing protein [Luteolibacter ambystomatis]|uniref:FecR domain-containing protein n=1 Tax=Luteolibacter ambystomatis TaxID=2824561 RepID=A0A975J1R7_9BACT|nr:FecR domain-containing protein [Luteolibacter ambystomatis]QUE52397.1 FecR domain-containing protein [Luteolibacter ambystomatis]